MNKQTNKQKEPIICRLQKTHFRAKCTQLKVREWKKIHHTNGNGQNVVIATLLSDKIDFKTKPIKKDKEGHNLMIKGSIQEKASALISISSVQ